MRILLLLAAAALALAGCGADQPAPSPAPDFDVFVFDSGGAYHIQGFGAWSVKATRAGLFEVAHQTGDEKAAYVPKPLAEPDQEALWAAIEGAGLKDLVVVDRPGVPDESIYTFGLRSGTQEVAHHEIWHNDLAQHASLPPLIAVLKDLIEKQHGAKPGF